MSKDTWISLFHEKLLLKCRLFLYFLGSYTQKITRKGSFS